jgi:hypothetical protein
MVTAPDDRLDVLAAAYTAARAEQTAGASAVSDRQCRYCGGGWTQWRGSQLDGHAKCQVTPAFKQQLAEFLGAAAVTQWTVADRLGVTVAVLRSWLDGPIVRRPRQNRFALSVSGVCYRRISAHCADAGISRSRLLEWLFAEELGTTEHVAAARANGYEFRSATVRLPVSQALFETVALHAARIRRDTRRGVGLQQVFEAAIVRLLDAIESRLEQGR